MAEPVYDEVEIEDMDYDEETETYYYPCPCGDRFFITKDDLIDGEDIATCPSCSLRIRVIYDEDDFDPDEDEDEGVATTTAVVPQAVDAAVATTEPVPVAADAPEQADAVPCAAGSDTVDLTSKLSAVALDAAASVGDGGGAGVDGDEGVVGDKAQDGKVEESNQGQRGDGAGVTGATDGRVSPGQGNAATDVAGQDHGAADATDVDVGSVPCGER